MSKITSYHCGFFCALRSFPLLTQIGIFAALGALAYGLIGLGISDVFKPERINRVAIWSGCLIGLLTYGSLIVGPLWFDCF